MIIARDEFCNSSKSAEKVRGGKLHFSCGRVVCQCYKRNRNEILVLISDILVRFSQQKNKKFSAHFARTSILASSLYHLGIIFVPPGLLSCLGKAGSFISFFETDLGTTIQLITSFEFFSLRFALLSRIPPSMCTYAATCFLERFLHFPIYPALKEFMNPT